ncbi:MAG: hypothetical protein H6833_12810 [Planctomycetes bacterium]|nr:hypothetical protein [Planctomycetota bacterium]
MNSGAREPGAADLQHLVLVRTRALAWRNLTEAFVLAFSIALALAVLALRGWIFVGPSVLAPAGALLVFAGVVTFLRPSVSRRVEELDACLGASGALAGAFEARRAMDAGSGLAGLAQRHWARRLAGSTTHLEATPRPWVGVFLFLVTAFTVMLLWSGGDAQSLPIGVPPSTTQGASARGVAASPSDGESVDAPTEGARIEERLTAARAAHERGELDADGWREALREATRSYAELARREQPSDGAPSPRGPESEGATAPEGSSGAGSSTAERTGGEGTDVSPTNALDSRIDLPDHLGLVVRRYFAR